MKKILVLLLCSLFFVANSYTNATSLTTQYDNKEKNIAALIAIINMLLLDDSTIEPIGPISAVEFASVSPPSYEQLMSICEDIIRLKPDLLQDESALAREIFDRVKEQNKIDVQGKNENIVSHSIFDLADRLTIDEWKVVLINPIDSCNSITTVKISLDSAKGNFPCDQKYGHENTKSDAFRHAYWNALMTKYSNFDFADKLSTAHESGSTTESATRMDLHNNKFGRELAKKYPEATEEQLLQLILQQKYIYIKDMKEIPANTKGLIYFENQEKYDGAMTGYLTNPDSGGPWDITLDMSQCGDIIRGQYTITRGSSLQKRRYTGSIDEANLLMKIDVAYPYDFENPAGVVPCQNMKMNLTANVNSLIGNWTSTNCSLGGEVNVSR